ncbi:MAG: hypothetical protein DVS81_17540 [Candidatus Accumulibacter meliphilus]|jgi:hypothetical protein|uniref:ATPase AAA-type core domain-containing protein n=1 Tax=Candidatus Accumulibacter meliphilus TaxID=2211374 RepID=A0A369XHB5_9PROT|nr:MAG: hypothetical protein DVS81_17540 [Candidatus Accumulibacter meliphilus]
MKVMELRFRGYKAYKGEPAEYQRLQLAPLTLVFGKNNSGKSAIVRLPRLLLGGLECKDGRVLPMEVRGLSYGSGFLDIVHGGDFFGRPEFHIHAEHHGEVLDFDVTLFSPGALSADEPPRIWSYEMRAPEKTLINKPRTSDPATESWAGLLPPEERWDKWRKRAGAVLDAMVYLGPTREPISSAYANEPFSSLDFRGAATPQLLRLDGILADKAGSWYAENMDGWRLSLKKDSDSFSLRVHRSRTLSTNLAHGGEGLQQVLPVVVHQLWRQQTDSGSFLDVVEQPELHLHAAAQAPLADLFIETALQGRGQVLVETNSQPILLRTQRRVAEGRLRPDQIAIYFVEMTESGSQLRPVTVLSNGDVNWWPPGVFEEDFNEAAAIRRAQRDRTTDATHS